LNQERKDEWAAVRYAHGVLTECGPFVSLAEGARHGGMSLSTLSKAVTDGRFPALRTATGLLVRLTAIDKRVGLHAGSGRPRKPRRHNLHLPRLSPNLLLAEQSLPFVKFVARNPAFADEVQ